VLYLTKHNDVYIRIEVDDPGILFELDDYFKFRVPGYRFMPAFKTGQWDGFVHLFSTRNRVLYIGLINHIEKFAKHYKIKYTVSPELDEAFSIDYEYVTPELELNVKGVGIIPYDYQEASVRFAIERKRGIILAPTSSGKSLIQYLIVREWMKSVDKILILVPTISLVKQLSSDFLDYSSTDDDFDESMVHQISGGREKDAESQIYISTWQSIFKQPKDYFDKFGAIMCDEVHTAKANSITKILEKLSDCPLRIGFIGILLVDDIKINKLVFEGLFGFVYNVVITKKLMDDKTIAPLKIKSLLLKYGEEDTKNCKKLNYQQEIDWIVTHPARNEFIIRLALLQKRNTLILFNFVEKHGKVLYEMIKDAESERPVYFVSGEVEADDREEIRRLTEGHSNAIIIASMGVFSTGVNIRNLHVMIFAHPSKSRIRVLQSIGRILRKSDNKDTAIMFDLADDLRHKKHKNYGLKHWEIRIKTYNEQKFDYEISKIRLQ
jgi:superfamily II DNA or RNA helicase